MTVPKRYCVWTVISRKRILSSQFDRWFSWNTRCKAKFNVSPPGYATSQRPSSTTTACMTHMHYLSRMLAPSCECHRNSFVWVKLNSVDKANKNWFWTIGTQFHSNQLRPWGYQSWKLDEDQSSRFEIIGLTKIVKKETAAEYKMIHSSKWSSSSVDGTSYIIYIFYSPKLIVKTCNINVWK